MIRAPDIEFAASELGLPALGYNIANTRLAEALFARAQDVLPEVVVGSVSQAVIAEDKVVLKLSDGAPLSAVTSATPVSRAGQTAPHRQTAS